MRSNGLMFVTILSGSLLVSACATKAPLALPPAPGPEQIGGNTSNAPAPGSQADFLAQMQGRDTIYFETDKYAISSDDATALQTQAQWLTRYPAKRATIEGHCDERGTREYNLALGERRATAAKNYLISLGVDANRLASVSYGKERPVALASDEASWAKNRRAVTVTID